jgi:hypothetical protein
MALDDTDDTWEKAPKYNAAGPLPLDTWSSRP